MRRDFRNASSSLLLVGALHQIWNVELLAPRNGGRMSAARATLSCQHDFGSVVKVFLSQRYFCPIEITISATYKPDVFSFATYKGCLPFVSGDWRNGGKRCAFVAQHIYETDHGTAIVSIILNIWRLLRDIESTPCFKILAFFLVLIYFD